MDDEARREVRFSTVSTRPAPRNSVPLGQLVSDESSYLPTHFLRGTALDVAEGRSRTVESLTTDDFITAAANFGLAGNLELNTAELVSIDRSTDGSGRVQLGLRFGARQDLTFIAIAAQYPLFVVGAGWSSTDPIRTRHVYGLETRVAAVGDIILAIGDSERAATGQ